MIKLDDLARKIKGDIETSSLYQIIYATDASAYREMPIGVVYPRDKEDIREIVRFAKSVKCNLIPRAAGTSLAGQVVGNGLIVDISRYMNKIIEINTDEHWVKVEPGVVLDTLHLFTKPHGLFFGPETSTSNRCCLGGMMGNNSCGLHSLVYGSVRDHILETTVILSDGSECVLKNLSRDELNKKLNLDSLEGAIYKTTVNILNENKYEIIDNFPDSSLHRRNMGYALDQLLYCDYFDKENDQQFNMSRLLAGSEGTLAFITELKLKLEPLPPKEKAVICVHCSTLEESFYGNLIALKHSPMAIELMDKKILDLSKGNIEQKKNLFFIQGEPEAILIIELACDTREAVDTLADKIVTDLKENKYGYHYPRLYGSDISRVWELRKAGLGLLSGMPGNAKPVSVIEDTAVIPERLPAYMSDFGKMLEQLGLDCVYHAHISTGELHLRPILDLKEDKDLTLFRKVAQETATLVKKYKGSLSGEHGDGRLRGEFIPFMFGEHVYQLIKEIKHIWDPDNIFNQGKIVDTPPMDQMLRYDKQGIANEKKNEQKLSNTYFDFSKQKGWLSAIEQCNGSGDCRKASIFGGTMCPSYRATLDEKNTTRARANVLRELLTNPKTAKIYDQKEILEVLDNCVSCKACKSECPSNIDMARFKAEFMQHHYDVSGIPLRSRLIGKLNAIQQLGTIYPPLYNFTVKNSISSRLIKNILQFSPKRNLPTLQKQTLKGWYKKYIKSNIEYQRKVYLFADEFTNFLDVEVGIHFVELLQHLGYQVIIPEHRESGRTALSKGMVEEAREIARKNLELLKDIISEDIPLVGIEPSCILSFRDEYPDLVGDDMKRDALKLGKNCLLYDEFIVREIEKGYITANQFTDQPLHILLHGHCHQKTLASVQPSKEMLSLPVNYKVEIIPSGCCGMAGSFGYEKKHYELSMKMGELVLFPTVRKADIKTCISAPGTSCRQQIIDGTGRVALHPIDLLYKAMKN